MKLLVVTSLFPRPRKPLNGVFNYQTLEAVRKEADVEIISPVSWIDRLRELAGPAAKVDEPANAEGYNGGLNPRYTTFFSIPYVGRALNGYFQYRSMKSVAERLAGENDFDILLAYWAYPDGYAASLLAKRCSLPYAVVALGSDLNVMGLSRQIREPLRRTLEGAAVVLTVSAALRDKAVSLGADPNRSFVVLNGVDQSLFHPLDRESCRKRLGLEADKKILLYVGTMDTVKGPDILIEALAKIEEAERPFSVIVGSGPLSTRMLRLSRELGLAASTRFVDCVPHGDLPFFFNAADLLVLSSRDEGCPNVVLEALACGTPVVATRVGGVPELIDGDDLGILVEPENPRRLADAIVAFFRRSWDRAAIARAKTRTWQDVARETMRIIENFTG